MQDQGQAADHDDVAGHDGALPFADQGFAVDPGAIAAAQVAHADAVAIDDDAGMRSRSRLIVDAQVGLGARPTSS